VGSVVARATPGQVFSKYFGFPCHSFTPLTAPQSSPFIIKGWYYRPINGRSNSGLGSAPAPKINKNKKALSYNDCHFLSRCYVPVQLIARKLIIKCFLCGEVGAQ
jgi:hypothetical protein